VQNSNYIANTISKSTGRWHDFSKFKTLSKEVISSTATSSEHNTLIQRTESMYYKTVINMRL